MVTKIKPYRIRDVNEPEEWNSLQYNDPNTFVRWEGGGWGWEYTAGEWISIWQWLDYSAMRWPCDFWFHVPTRDEAQFILGIAQRSNSQLPWSWVKAPNNGFIKFQNPNIYASWTRWTCTASGNTGEDHHTNAYMLCYDNSGYTPDQPLAPTDKSYWCWVRAFKDNPVIPDDTWTIIWQNQRWAFYWNETLGLITAHNTDNNQYVTLQDKNVGATNVGDNWLYFQWGNNQWFTSASAATSTTKVDASWYEPSTYAADPINTSYDWSSEENDNLWGWVTWAVTIENVITNTGVLSVNWETWHVTVASPDMSNYLAKNNTTAFTPTWDYNPSTKKYVDDKFATLMGLGKFLSLWDSSTWLPISFPLTIPYTYHTWDYFMIETVASGWGTNYRPDGSSYSGTASSVTESETVQRWDFYIYDGTVWLFASNHGWSVSFSNIAGQPTDNANLAAALNQKQNKLIAGTDLSITPGTEIFTLPTWYTQLDYIALDGVWYFNTGVTLADTDKLDITFTTSPDYTGTYFLWGKNGSAGTTIWFISPSANLIQWNERPTSVSIPVWTRVFMQLESGKVVYTALGTTVTKTFTGWSVSSTWACLIWGAWEDTLSNVDSRRFYGYVHKRQILDNTDTLRFNWVPCKNSSDQYWFYDTVSNTFIQSAVTATITWWPEANPSDIISFTNVSRYIKNTATGDGSITIWSSNPAPWNNWVNIWPWSYSAWYAVWIGSGAYANWGYGVAIGTSSSAANTSAIAIGRWAKAQALNSISIGRDATTSGLNWIAIWKDAKNSSAYAIQLWKGTIGGASNEYQFYVGFDGINQNWKMLDGTTWLIPDARLSSNVQTVSNLVTTLTWADDTHYPSAKAVADAITSAWGWDMLKNTYDPNNVEADAFDYRNFTNTPTIPTKTSDLNNDSWFITWISSNDVTTALWYTPANNANLWTAATKNTWTSSWNVPVLDSNWKLANSTLPWVALTDTFTVSTSSDLITLSSAEQWDLAIVTSENKTYVLSQAPYSTASNWKQILSPTWWVTSVNGQTWAVTLSIPTKTSDLNNDSWFITSSALPTKISDLINDSDFLENKATGTSSLTVLGTETARTQATNVGALSQATANYWTALWSYSQANGSHAVAIWNYARTTWQYTIQLWKGTTSANNKLYAGFESNNYELLDGTTWKIPNDRLNIDATPTASSTNAVTSWGVYSAISAINWTIIAATAPLSPTEWMVWYDTTNDVLKTYDWNQWNECWSWWWDTSNVKAFYLTWTTWSSNIEIAQWIFDWENAGKTAVINYSNRLYIKVEWSWTYMKFMSMDSQWNTTSWYSKYTKYYIQININWSSVISIQAWNDAYWYLKVWYDYSTPYTPQYDWSPATKKYVDDSVSVVSGDSGVTYTIKVSNSDPTSWTASNIITLVP